MRPGIVTVSVEDADNVVVNILDSEGRVVEAHNAGQRFKEEERFHRERDRALGDLEEAQERETRVRLAHMNVSESLRVLRQQYDSLTGLHAGQKKNIRELIDKHGAAAEKLALAENEVARLIHENAAQRQELVAARGARVDAGQQVYLLDVELGEELKALLKTCKPGPIIVGPREPVWQPIATAPKDGTTLLIYCERRGEHVGKWLRHKECWIVTGGDSIVPTHWMPLPEPPR